MFAVQKEVAVMSLELDSRIDALTVNLRPYIRTIFQELCRASPENAAILNDFLIAEQTEMNIRDSTKEWKIKVLVWLSRHLAHESFKQMSKQDILSFLNKLRKPESADPSHKWTG